MGLLNLFKKKKTEPLDLDDFDEVLEFDEGLYNRVLKSKIIKEKQSE